LQANDPASDRKVDAAMQADADAVDAVALSCRGFSWRCVPEHVPLLTDPDAPDWQNLRTEPAAELIKRNGPREVWCVRTASLSVFAKAYRPVKVGDWLRALLFGSASHREWRAGRYAQRAGLATPLPIACGWKRRLGRGILLTRAVDHSVPLHTYWTAFETANDRRGRYQKSLALCHALAELLARAHQSGMRHLDLHPGNLLVQDVQGSAPRVVMVDLQSARIGRPVKQWAALQNLVQLNQWFQRHASRSERLRFLRSYLVWHERLSHLKHARRVQADLRPMLSRLDRMARRHARRLWAKRDRTAMRSGRYFSRMRIPGGWRGHVVLQPRRPVAGLSAREVSFTRAQWREWLDDPSEWTGRRRTQLIKGSHSGTVCRAMLPLDDGAMEVICKRPLPRTWWKRVLFPFGASRNLRTWRRGHALLHRDLPTARPLAVLERRCLGLLLDSLVMTESITDGRDLDTMLRLHLAPQSGQVLRRVKDQLAGRLAKVIRQMHERGFAHRDLKASNILVQWRPGQGAPPGVALIDLDGLRLRRRVRQRNELRALARLNASLDLCITVTATDRLRFLRAYLGASGYVPGGFKPLWRRLAELSDGIRKHKAKRLQWKLDHYGRP